MDLRRLFLFCCVVAAKAAWDSGFDPKNTITLNGNNFEQVKEDTWFVMFWAPWCGHCRRVKPLFADASELAKDKPVKLGMMDCTTEEGKPFCESLGVTSYPTFQYAIPGTELMKYDGPRSTEDFIRFIVRLGDKSLHVLKFTDADLRELEKRDDVNVFIFCTPEERGITKQITWIARRGLAYGRSHFGIHPSSSALCGGRNTAFLLNDIGKTEIQPEKGTVEVCMEDEVDSACLKSVLDWVSNHKHLAVDRIDQATFQHVAHSDKPLLLMFVTKEGQWEDVRPFLNVLRKVLKKPAADHFSFGWLDGSTYGEWVAELISLDMLPTILVYHVTDESSFFSESSKIAVQHAVSSGGDADGAMQAAAEDIVEGIVSGRYQLTYSGPAGHVLGFAQRFLPFIVPHLKELRRSAQSDVLFLAMVAVITILLGTILVNFIQLALGSDPYPDPAARPLNARVPSAVHQQQGNKKSD